MLDGATSFMISQRLIGGILSMSRPSRKRLMTGVLAICILLLTVGCRPTLQQLEEQNLDTLYQIAETVGYTPDALIIQGRYCWDPSLFPPYTEECAIFVIFTIDATVPEVQTMIDNLNYKELYHQFTNIRSLATLINYDTSKTLYIDGTNASNSENDEKLRGISGQYWYLRDDQDRTLDITLFLTVDTDAQLAIDDMPVEQNLLLVDLSLGRTYP